jgi:hypothetical protein
MKQNTYFHRSQEAVPILKAEPTPGKIVVTPNGQTLDNGETRREDFQPENIHSSSRGVIAQVSLIGCEKLCFYVMGTIHPLCGPELFAEAYRCIKKLDIKITPKRL